MTMKKKILAMIVAATMILTFASCTKTGGESKDNVDALPAIRDVIFETLKQNLIDNDGMAESDFNGGDLLVYTETKPGGEDFYPPVDLPEGAAKDAVFFQAMMMTNSDLIVVIEYDDIATAEQYMDDLRSYQEGVWGEYLPDQMEKVQNSVTETIGKYIVYITYSDADGLMDAISAVVK